jgi:hypothetical protein
MTIEVQIRLADGQNLERIMDYDDFYSDRSHGLVMIGDYAIQLIPFTLYRQTANIICGEEITDFKEFSVRRVNR